MWGQTHSSYLHWIRAQVTTDFIINSWAPERLTVSLKLSFTKQSMLCIQTPQFGCYPISNTCCFSQHIPDGNNGLQRRCLCLNAPQLKGDSSGRQRHRGRRKKSQKTETDWAVEPTALLGRPTGWSAAGTAGSATSEPHPTQQPQGQGCGFRPQRSPPRHATTARLWGFLYHPR